MSLSFFSHPISHKWWCFLLFSIFLVEITCIIYLHKTAPHAFDFPQYYLGGLVACEGDWSNLYPIPNANSSLNPGFESTPKPGLTKLLQDRCEGCTCFIQPPFAAICFIPLGWFKFKTARWIWVILMAISVWAIGVLSGWLYRYLSCISSPTITELAIIITIILSPRSIIFQTHGNISPLIGLLIIGSIYYFIKDKFWPAIIILVIGTGLKFAPLALFPPALFIKIRQAFVILILVGLITIIVMVSITGFPVIWEYLTVISPTLTHPSLTPSFQTRSIYLIPYSFINRTPLPYSVLLYINLTKYILIFLIFMLMFKKREELQRFPSSFVASCAAMLCLFLIFSPTVWEYYIYYLAGFTGWVLLEMKRDIIGKLLGGGFLFCLWFPWGRIPGLGQDRFPMKAWLLIASTLLLILASFHLLKQKRSKGYDMGKID